jgi:hypothetical protein
MSRLVRKNCSLMKLLARSPPKRRREIIKLAPKELVHSFSEGALNVLKGNIRLSKKKQASLKRYKTNVYNLASRKTSLAKKKQVLMSGGAFFPLLASIIIPAITALITRR